MSEKRKIRKLLKPPGPGSLWIHNDCLAIALRSTARPSFNYDVRVEMVKFSRTRGVICLGWWHVYDFGKNGYCYWRLV